MTGRKIRGLRKMLNESGHPAEEIAQCLVALETIEQAHWERNEVVHGHGGTPTVYRRLSGALKLRWRAADRDLGNFRV